MSDKVKFTLDGKTIEAKAGQTIMEAADDAGVYIPRLCAFSDVTPHGSCRVCVVNVDGRCQASCTQPVAEGIKVESETDEINQIRKDMVEMLFVEGNHFCMFCEKSGNCELQAMAYKFKMMAPKYPYQFPEYELDASHPDIMIDRNRCILCGRCVRASRDIDGKSVFGFVGRGKEKRIAVNSSANLKGTKLDITDKACDVCPVGAIIKKRVGFAVPVGQREFDKAEIGSKIENK